MLGAMACASQATHPRAGWAPVGGPPALGLVHIEQRGQDSALVVDLARSRASRCRRGTVTRARLLDQQVQRGGFRGAWYFLTFTYRDGADWQPQDIKGWLHATRKQFQRNGSKLHYVWVAELQKRGAIHYHAVVWVPRGQFIRRPDQAGTWTKGSTNVQKARNAVGYLAKYAGKGMGVQCGPDGRELKFPRGARIHGAGGLVASSVVEARWWLAPRWLRTAIGELTDVQRVPGGWLERATGQFHRSPWVFCGFLNGFSAAVFREAV